MTDIFDSPWWERALNSLADHVDMMGYEFAARMIRERVNTTLSFGKGFKDLTSQEIGDIVKEAHEADDVCYFRIDKEGRYSIHTQRDGH